MPIRKSEDFGTTATGAKNLDYCWYCFRKGQFLEPDITKEQMIEKVADALKDSQKMPPEKAKAYAEGLIPTLKRWKERQGG
jgi:hypothetical protein